MKDFYIFRKEYLYKDMAVMKVCELPINDDKIMQVFLKQVRKFYEKDNNISDEQIFDNMNVIDLPKPKSYPKYNNETPHTLKIYGKTHKNPKIIATRWDGYDWEYCFKKIGHKGSFYGEKIIEEIK